MKAILSKFIALVTVLLWSSFSIAQSTVESEPSAITKPQMETVFPAGSAFGMAPFQGSSEAQEFTGFINLADSSSVMINELPAESWTEISTQFQDKATLEIAGITAKNIAPSQIGGMEAIRISGTQLFQGSYIPKCIILVRGLEKVGMFSAQIPGSENSPQDACDLINGVAQRPAATLTEKLKSLPFGLKDLAGMRLANVLGGSGAVLTDGPLEKSKASEQPVLIVVSSLSPTALGQDRKTFSETLVRSIASYRTEKILETNEMSLAQLPAIEIRAIAKDTDSNDEINVVQWVAFAPDGHYLRVIGLASPEKWSDASIKFQKLRDNIYLKEE